MEKRRIPRPKQVRTVPYTAVQRYEARIRKVPWRLLSPWRLQWKLPRALL